MKVILTIQRLFFSASSALRKRLFIVFTFLIVFNGVVWICAFFIWHHYPLFFALITIAYGLGLRHAVDADHIATIDNTTRKLMQEGKKPVTIGLFFSLGHATIVIILSILVVLSSTVVRDNLPKFKSMGEILGTSISSFFLLIIGIINLIILIDTFRLWKSVIKNNQEGNNTYHTITSETSLNQYRPAIYLLKPFIKAISNSWHMYFIGFLFGLGFDTASEVGLLSISASTSTLKIPFAYIILIPFAFTAGMCLIDTMDGILMLGTYGWAYIKPIRKLYYNMNITLISVSIALLIGSIEAMQVFILQLQLKGGIYTFIKNLNFASLGYITIAMFILIWIISILIYKRKKYDLLDVNKAA